MKLSRILKSVNLRRPRPVLARRLVAVMTPRHRHTLANLVPVMAARGVHLRLLTWEHVLRARRLPGGTYIFTDFDRLHPWYLECAGHLYDRLRDAGVTVLNDPRLFMPRAALLRKLYARSVNDFTCWLPAMGERPERFPVFLRTIAAHRGVLGELLHTEAEAETALRDALIKGYVLSDLCFVEYRAHPTEAGTFRKLACMRLGRRLVPMQTVTQHHWVAKYGELGAATPEQYKQDLAEFDNYPHSEAITRAFDIANVDFGRADFAVVDGRLQIYEINTNPRIGWVTDHPDAARRETEARIRDSLADALSDLAPEIRPPSVRVWDGLPRKQRPPRRLRQP